MKYLLSATVKQVVRIAVKLRDIQLAETDAKLRDILGVARREITPGVRYYTIEWVMGMLEQQASNIDNAGYCDDADKWYHVADMLHNLLYELDTSDD